MTDSQPSSLQRGLVVIAWIASQQRPCGVREIATATGINKSSVHRFLEALWQEGWICRDGSSDKYSLGPVPIEIGLAALGTMEHRVVAHPFLEEMSSTTGETSYLGTLSHTDVVYIDVVLGGHSIIASRNVGARLPAHRTAIGKALLAGLSTDRLDQVIADVAGSVSGEEGSLLDAERLRTQLGEIQVRGLAYNDEESGPGIYSLAAPVFDLSRNVVAGIGIGGPKERILPRHAEYETLVKNAATEISKKLGCQGDSPGCRPPVRR